MVHLPCCTLPLQTLQMKSVTGEGNSQQTFSDKGATSVDAGMSDPQLLSGVYFYLWVHIDLN